MATPFIPVPDWFPWENQGADIAVADINGDGQLDLVVFQIDDPAGENVGLYRIGWTLQADAGVTGGWGPWMIVPDWFAWENQGAGIAVADINGNGQLDLIVFQIDNPAGKNEGYYRIGWDLNAAGAVTGGWSVWTDIPDWPFWENQDGSIALADIDGNGRLDLVVFQIDNPGGKNDGYYRVGWNLNTAGNVTGGWSPWRAVADWPYWENQGAGIAITDLDGNGRPDLVVFQVDNPGAKNDGYYCIGWDLDAEGVARGGWGAWTKVPDWAPWENQGAGIALASLDGAGPPQLIVLQVDNPGAQNAGLYRVLDLVLNGDAPETDGVWRILPFDTQVLAIHAALLHTGKVLFFSGSSNNPVNLNPGDAEEDFRSIVWDYEAGTFFRPFTPIDFFCAGQSFLPDGRLLVAGGTKTYDPFFGLPDAYVFDPHDEQWKLLPPMTGGRWYPTLVTLADGSVLAMSGLGELGEDPYQDIELFTDHPPAWTTLQPSLSKPWPLYAHVFLLSDGRLFYTGGQYNKNYGQAPCLIDLSLGTVTPVGGLADAHHRNQSASALLPPAQDARVMIIGGGAEFGGAHHHAVEATKQVSIIQPLTAPAYQAGPTLTWGRMHHNAVILPDRTLLICGGSGLDESRELARLTGEIYDPATNAWSLTAPSRVPRLYHSIAILMPDGRVITAGSNPERGDEELRIEVYHPSYLFRGPRPVIDAVPDDLT
jgi:hypothetical protein